MTTEKCTKNGEIMDEKVDLIGVKDVNQSHQSSIDDSNDNIIRDKKVVHLNSIIFAKEMK